MKQFAIISLLLATILSACSRHSELSDALAAADAVVCTDPDSALAILSRADTTAAPDRLRAHYILLTEKASDKADIVHTDDSLITAAVRYYTGRNDSLEAQALYYNGVVQFNNRDFGQALISLMQAHEVAQQAGDRFYQAMSSRTLADVYDELLSFDAAARCDSMALEEFYKADRPDYAMYERYYLPYYYAQAGRFAEADSLLDLNAEDPFFFETPIRTSWYYQTRALSSFLQSDYSSAAMWYDSCMSLVPEKITSSHWTRIALANLKLKNDSIAGLAIDRAIAKSNSARDSLFASLAFANKMSNQGLVDKAYQLKDSIYGQYNKYNNALLTHPYTTLLTNYLKEQSTQRLNALSMAKSQLLLGFCFTCLILLLSIMVINYLIRRKKRVTVENTILLEDIERIKHQYDVILNDSNAQEKLDPVFINLLNSLFDLENNAPQSIDGYVNLRNKLVARLSSMVTNGLIEQLEKLVNARNNNILMILRTQVPELTLRQFQYLILNYSGFSNVSICKIMNLKTINALYKMKSRVKTAIQNSEIENKEFVVNLLS